MANSKFKVGDHVKIIGEGHIIWEVMGTTINAPTLKGIVPKGDLYTIFNSTQSKKFREIESSKLYLVPNPKI